MSQEFGKGNESFDRKWTNSANQWLKHFVENGMDKKHFEKFTGALHYLNEQGLKSLLEVEHQGSTFATLFRDSPDATVQQLAEQLESAVSAPSQFEQNQERLPEKFDAKILTPTKTKSSDSLPTKSHAPPPPMPKRSSETKLKQPLKAKLSNVVASDRVDSVEISPVNSIEGCEELLKDWVAIRGKLKSGKIEKIPNNFTSRKNSMQEWLDDLDDNRVLKGVAKLECNGIKISQIGVTSALAGRLDVIPVTNTEKKILNFSSERDVVKAQIDAETQQKEARLKECVEVLNGVVLPEGSGVDSKRFAEAKGKMTPEELEAAVKKLGNEAKEAVLKATEEANKEKLPRKKERRWFKVFTRKP